MAVGPSVAGTGDATAGGVAAANAGGGGAAVNGAAADGGTTGGGEGANRRTEGFTSGCGNIPANSLSTSCLLLSDAAASSSTWFDAVRRRASMRAVVGLSVPATSMSRTTGNLRAARADSIRFMAASSESRSTSMQYLNVEEKPRPA